MGMFQNSTKETKEFEKIILEIQDYFSKLLMKTQRLVYRWLLEI